MTAAPTCCVLAQTTEGRFHADDCDDRYRLLQTADEADRYITDADLDEALDWFDDEPRMATDEYLDRLLGPALRDENGRELDLDSFDNGACKRIMSRARKLRKEREL